MQNRAKRLLSVNVALLVIGLLDLLTTVVWLRGGHVVEANPIMAAVLRAGVPLFVFVKLGTLTCYVAVIEWYRQRNPKLARAIGNITVFAYVLIYSTSFCYINYRYFLQ